MVKLTCLLSTYYDLPLLLQGRLDNLLTQDVDYELIVICEKGSKEFDIIVNWERKNNTYSRVEYITKDGIPTLYDAWNMGIEIADGEYITNTNTDDRLYPGALQKMIDVLDANPDVGVVYPDVDRVDEIDAEPFGQFTWAEGGLEVLIKGEYGLFGPEFHSSGDYDFWLRLAANGVKFKRIPEPLGRYFDREESIEHREPVRTVWETARARSKHRERH
jgi:GT2 family glycosyltransferase